MMKRVLVLALMLVVAVAAFPAFAQEDDEETITYIAEAFSNVNKLDFYCVEGVLELDQLIAAQGTEVPTVIEQEIEACIAYDEGVTVAVDATLDQTFDVNLGFGDQTGEMSLDIRVVDDTVYLRVYDLSGLFAGQFDENWAILGQDSTADVITEAFGDPDTLIASFSQQLLYPINVDTVAEVTAIESDDVTEEEGWVGFVMEMDALAVFSSADMEGLMGTIDASQLGMEPEELMEMLIVGDPEDESDDATLVLTVYIDQEDDTVRRVDSEIIFDSTLTVMGLEMELDQAAVGSFIYSNFDEAFEVEVPQG